MEWVSPLVMHEETRMFCDSFLGEGIRLAWKLIGNTHREGFLGIALRPTSSGSSRGERVMFNRLVTGLVDYIHTVRRSTPAGLHIVALR